MFISKGITIKRVTAAESECGEYIAPHLQLEIRHVWMRGSPPPPSSTTSLVRCVVPERESRKVNCVLTNHLVSSISVELQVSLRNSPRDSCEIVGRREQIPSACIRVSLNQRA